MPELGTNSQPQKTTAIPVPSPWALAFGGGTPRKAFLTALVVGTILTVINHGDTLAAGHLPPLLKVCLTYCVPYCVTTWGAITGKLSLLREAETARVTSPSTS